MRKFATSAFLCTLLFGLNGGAVSTVSAAPFGNKAEQRTNIDGMATKALERLWSKSDRARALYDQAYGYAVFDIVKVSLAVTGGGGRGVAVAKDGAARTCMRMGTGGLNFGAGGQKYPLVFLFQDRATFETFVTEGWEAGASAHAVAGTLDANAGATFINGVALYQLTEAGLMLQADVSGTKYWQSNLNER
jgi:lipid-binding SYLF domain-containing protein